MAARCAHASVARSSGGRAAGCVKSSVRRIRSRIPRERCLVHRPRDSINARRRDGLMRQVGRSPAETLWTVGGPRCARDDGAFSEHLVHRLLSTSKTHPTPTGTLLRGRSCFGCHRSRFSTDERDSHPERSEGPPSQFFPQEALRGWQIGSVQASAEACRWAWGCVFRCPIGQE